MLATVSQHTEAALLDRIRQRVGQFAVEPLVERIVAILEGARSQVVRAVNSTMVLADWDVGRKIVEFVQRGSARAKYGEQVLEDLSERLRQRVERRYSVTNLRTSASSTSATQTSARDSP